MSLEARLDRYLQEHRGERVQIQQLTKRFNSLPVRSFTSWNYSTGVLVAGDTSSMTRKRRQRDIKIHVLPGNSKGGTGFCLSLQRGLILKHLIVRETYRYWVRDVI